MQKIEALKAILLPFLSLTIARQSPQLLKNGQALAYTQIILSSMWGSFGMGGGYGGYGGGGFLGGGFCNRWSSPGYHYQSMPGYIAVDYSAGWNPMHDQMLINNINMVYQRYDYNFTGQLEGNEFFYAYRDLCLMMGVAPPMTYQDIWNAMMTCDTNRDGRISKMEMFMLFKRIQGINMGMMQPQVYGWY